MGLFDTVELYVGVTLPEYPETIAPSEDVDWQTKGIDRPSMTTFRITADGRLLEAEWHLEDVPPEDRPYAGRDDVEPTRNQVAVFALARAVHTQTHGFFEGFRHADTERWRAVGRRESIENAVDDGTIEQRQVRDDGEHGRFDVLQLCQGVLQVPNVSLARRFDGSSLGGRCEMVAGVGRRWRADTSNGTNLTVVERSKDAIDHRSAADLEQRFLAVGVQSRAPPATHQESVHTITPACNAATRPSSFVAPSTSPLRPPRALLAQA